MALLDLAYSGAVPRDLLQRMERAARGLGLPLEAIERLGQDADLCARFVAAAEQRDLPRVALLAGTSDVSRTVPVLPLRVRPSPRAPAHRHAPSHVYGKHRVA